MQLQRGVSILSLTHTHTQTRGYRHHSKPTVRQSSAVWDTHNALGLEERWGPNSIALEAQRVAAPGEGSVLTLAHKPEIQYIITHCTDTAHDTIKTLCRPHKYKESAARLCNWIMGFQSSCSVHVCREHAKCRCMRKASLKNYIYIYIYM